MLAAPIPADETDRLAALDKLDLVYAEEESSFDRVTKYLAQLFDAPAVMMNVIDHDSQYVKSSAGMPGDVVFAPIIARKDSICGHVVYGNDSLVIEDLAADERFRDNPIVKKRGLRFYAGAPLRDDDGHAVGALCVVDIKPRHITDKEQMILEIAADQLMREVKLRNMARDLIDRNRTYERDMASARKVQRFLLPPPRQASGGLKLSHYYHPLDSIGGDFLDTRWRPDGSMILLVADVSGHGASAALTSAMVKTIFQRAAAHVADPGQMLTAVASELGQTGDTFQFVTAIAALFDPAAQTVMLGTAGHPSPMLLRGGKISAVQVAGSLPLLVEPEQVYSQHTTLPLRPGDRLIFYTDGATEAADPNGNMLGTQGLGPMIESCKSSLVEEMPHDLFEKICAFANKKLRDDVALVCVEWTGTIESHDSFGK